MAGPAGSRSEAPYDPHAEDPYQVPGRSHAHGAAPARRPLADDPTRRRRSRTPAGRRRRTGLPANGAGQRPAQQPAQWAGRQPLPAAAEAGHGQDPRRARDQRAHPGAGHAVHAAARHRPAGPAAAPGALRRERELRLGQAAQAGARQEAPPGANLPATQGPSTELAPSATGRRAAGPAPQRRSRRNRRRQRRAGAPAAARAGPSGPRAALSRSARPTRAPRAGAAGRPERRRRGRRRPHPLPDDELPPEPLDNPRRLLVWPAPDMSTQQALSDRGYRPVIVNSREEVDAQIAAYPAALFVDPLTGPITRTALQSLRTAAVAAEVPVLVTAGLGQATREAAYGADPAVLLKALAPRDSEQHPPRVLLIEQHEPIASALTATLERRGMQVARAATDADAVALAAQTRPNLVVMDLMQVRRRRAGIVDWLRGNGLLNHTRSSSTPRPVSTRTSCRGSAPARRCSSSPSAPRTPRCRPGSWTCWRRSAPTSGHGARGRVRARATRPPTRVRTRGGDGRPGLTRRRGLTAAVRGAVRGAVRATVPASGV
ncbi:hypothetical protein NKH77_26065 [Streptomyces sp. M19]